MLRPYVKEKRYTVRTEHTVLRWILKMADALHKLARWSLALQEVKLDIIHRLGIEHDTADALSRLEPDGADTYQSEYDIPVLLVQDANASSRPTCCVIEVCEERECRQPVLP